MAPDRVVERLRKLSRNTALCKSPHKGSALTHTPVCFSPRRGWTIRHSSFIRVSINRHPYTVNYGFWITETQILSVSTCSAFYCISAAFLTLSPCVRVWATRRPRQRVWGAWDRAPCRKRPPPSAFLPWSTKYQRILNS